MHVLHTHTQHTYLRIHTHVCIQTYKLFTVSLEALAVFFGLLFLCVHIYTHTHTRYLPCHRGRAWSAGSLFWPSSPLCTYAKKIGQIYVGMYVYKKLQNWCSYSWHKQKVCMYLCNIWHIFTAASDATDICDACMSNYQTNTRTDTNLLPPLQPPW